MFPLDTISLNSESEAMKGTEAAVPLRSLMDAQKRFLP